MAKNDEVLAALRDLKAMVSDLTKGQVSLSAEQERQAAKMAENEMTLLGIVEEQKKLTVSLNDREKNIEVDLEAKIRAKHDARAKIMSDEKVEVIWHGPAVTYNGVSCGPFEDGSVQQVPHWVPYIWKVNAQTEAETKKFRERYLWENAGKHDPIGVME